ncbi:MAG: hypothetical protein KBD76_03010 [Bacteriovorax sp.]|nr:hypothetical protein [Bacteriovorax sp.]
MKKCILSLCFLLSSFSVFAYNPTLDPVILNVEGCLNTQKVMLCSSELPSLLKSLSMDVRGEFAMYLRELLQTHKNEQVVHNLYIELQSVIDLYEKLDTQSNWSFRAIKNLLDDVAIEYVKLAPIDQSFLTKLYKNQGGIGGRFGLLTTLNDKLLSLTSIVDMENLIRFLEVAKEYSRSIRDEQYVYNTAVEMIRKLTDMELKIRPGHEGIFSIVFDNPEMAKTLKIDTLVVIESNSKDSLVVNFVASNSRLVKMSFTGAIILGDTISSNLDVYNNGQDTANPFFKFELDRQTNTIKGTFSTARYGVMNFSGTLMKSNLSVYDELSVKGLRLDQLTGSFKVKVGSFQMQLIIRKRTDDRSVTEAALFNDNAMISFSKVTLNSEKGVLSLVDINNERKLSLAVLDMQDGPLFKGQFINAPQAKILEVLSN